MAILSLNNYLVAKKQLIYYYKTSGFSGTTGTICTFYNCNGLPSLAALAIGDTTNGIILNDTILGYPSIGAFNPGAIGYLTKIKWVMNGMSGEIGGGVNILFDNIYGIGALAYNVDVSPTSPSWANKNGGSYVGLELWIENVTDITGSQSIQVNYLDQDGNAGDTGVVSIGDGRNVGRMFQIPLGSGDSGISAITRIRSTLASAGTFNLKIMRRLWSNFCPANLLSKTDSLITTGMPIIYEDSALSFAGVVLNNHVYFRAEIEISNG